MTQLKKENKDKFTRQFSRWEKCLAAAKVKSCEELYKKVHAAILANSDRKKVDQKAKKPVHKVVKKTVEGKVYENSKKKQWYRAKKMTHEDRAARVQAKFASMME